MTEYQFSDDYLQRKIKKLEHQAEILRLSISYHKDWQKRLSVPQMQQTSKKKPKVYQQLTMFGI